MKASSKLLLVLLLGSTLSACGLMPQKGSETPGTTQAPVAPKPPDKGDPQARFNAALDLWKQNQIAETETALKELTTDFPQYSGPWTNLGILYAKSNRRDLALAALNNATTLNADNDVAFNWLGMLYREGRDYNRALTAYNRALKINPNSALAHYNLAILLDEHLKQPQQALPHYSAYQKLSGKQDLKVLAWVAEIEAKAKAATPAPAAAVTPPAAVPAPGAAR